MLGDSPVLRAGSGVEVDVADGVSVDVEVFSAWANAVAAPTIASEMDSFFG